MAAPSPIFCLEFQRLKNRYRMAASEYLRMQTAYMEALIKGDADIFASEVNAARQPMEEAKYAILEHQEQHKCGPD
jgi:hypothetical protein